MTKKEELREDQVYMSKELGESEARIIYSKNKKVVDYAVEQLKFIDDWTFSRNIKIDQRIRKNAFVKEAQRLGSL